MLERVRCSSPEYPSSWRFDMDNLKGRVALITGGGRGIGRAITAVLAEAGCDVAINYVARRADAEDVAAAIRASGDARQLYRPMFPKAPMCDVSFAKSRVRLGQSTS